jgi:hypothetical protein
LDGAAKNFILNLDTHGRHLFPFPYYIYICILPNFTDRSSQVTSSAHHSARSYISFDVRTKTNIWNGRISPQPPSSSSCSSSSPPVRYHHAHKAITSCMPCRLVSRSIVFSHVHAYAMSEGFSDACNNGHPSGAYKGPCWPLIKNEECSRVCIGENSDNLSGSCNIAFQCWCWTGCDSKIAVAAAATPPPIQP